MRWFFFVPANLVMLLLAYILAPILPIFSKDGWLPRWLWWFQTPDFSLDGDGGWQDEHWQFRKKLSPTLSRYVGQVGWLWRNPAYGFDWTVLAFKPKRGYKMISHGTRPVSGSVEHNGWFFAMIHNLDGSSAWQLYITIHLTKTHSTKFNFGWKLWMAPAKCSFVNSFTGFWKKI